MRSASISLSWLFRPAIIGWLLLLPAAALAQAPAIVERPPDPHGSPRPPRDALHVPVRTSLYVELRMGGRNAPPSDDGIDADTLTLTLTPAGGQPVELIATGRKFAEGYTGWVRTRQRGGGADYSSAESLAIYVDGGPPLKPGTRYTATVSATSAQGQQLSGPQSRWSFTTAEAAAPTPLDLSVDLSEEPVRWQGQFFSGPCNVWFSSRAGDLPTFELTRQIREKHPRAFSFQRDFWMTGFNREPGIFSSGLPNIVRELETRRIADLAERPDGMLLQVEDFFGHEQYGIPANRPLSDDYHPGDVVLIMDPKQSAEATVISVDDESRTVLVTRFEEPAGGWKIAYSQPLPTKEDPHQPGLFPAGGCHLVKLRPHGTARYYWGRLDKEFDLIHRTYGRRLLPNFADAPGDLSRDGRNWTAPKDFAQHHQTVRDIAGHIIDRYGDESLNFTWSVFNEPDLGGHFWRADWDDLQRFYDYTVDGVLRAFEDRGYDSNRVFVGGLELGGIFGTNLKLREFLAHCSPTATARGALLKNAAVADKRLDGKRSRRVEELCARHDGQGTPCDFLSIHSYNSAEMMAAKLIRAKEMALEIDPEFYAGLWINSHESCPEWSLPPDVAAADSYSGNGYAETWCVDVASRLLHKAAEDPRYGFGETLFTVWPPLRNFGGANAFTRDIDVDDSGDQRRDRTQTVATPLLHTAALLSDFHDRFWMLPTVQQQGHSISGFASRNDAGAVRVMVYAHQIEDPQSRSDAEYNIELTLAGLPAGRAANIVEHRIDKQNNSYFEDVVRLRGGPERQRGSVFGRLGMANAFPAAEIAEIERKSQLKATAESRRETTAEGTLRLPVRISGNGLNVLVITPQ